MQAQLDDPFLLNPPGTAPADAASHRDPVGALRDADFDAWLAPFMMGPINTRVVRRSVALLADERSLCARLSLPGIRCASGRGASGALIASARRASAWRPAARRWPSSRCAVLRRASCPAPGEGPSEQAMDSGSFRCELIGVGERGTVQRGRIAGRGDPGNRATTVFVCEAALALALDAAQLPGGARLGGVLTPSVAFGKVLAQRLRSAGMTVEPTEG